MRSWKIGARVRTQEIRAARDFMFWMQRNRPDVALLVVAVALLKRAYAEQQGVTVWPQPAPKFGAVVVDEDELVRDMLRENHILRRYDRESDSWDDLTAYIAHDPDDQAEPDHGPDRTEYGWGMELPDGGLASVTEGDWTPRMTVRVSTHRKLGVRLLTQQERALLGLAEALADQGMYEQSDRISFTVFEDDLRVEEPTVWRADPARVEAWMRHWRRRRRSSSLPGPQHRALREQPTHDDLASFAWRWGMAAIYGEQPYEPQRPLSDREYRDALRQVAPDLAKTRA